MRLFLNPRFLLPLMVVVGLAVLGLRVSDLWTSASSGRLFARPALAETKSDAPADKSADAKPSDTKAAEAPKTDELPKPEAAAPTDEEMSPAEIEVLKQLSGRREELDKRSKDLDQRGALIKIAEQRVDQKVKELEALRQQLQSMVNQVNETQAAQMENLVKMYETMKPDDAAKIFETLDMPILLNVIQRMKPKNTAPIMAKMAPEKAKEITVALTKQDQLPKVK